MLYCFYPLTAIFAITPEWPGTWSRVGVSGERVRERVVPVRSSVASTSCSTGRWK